MIFFMFKKVSESHWCKEIKKLLWCSGKIIDSVLLDDEILNFLDQNILADFRHCICIPQKWKFFLKYIYVYILMIKILEWFQNYISDLHIPSFVPEKNQFRKWNSVDDLQQRPVVVAKHFSNYTYLLKKHNKVKFPKLSSWQNIDTWSTNSLSNNVL